MDKPWLAHYEDGVPAHIEYPAIALHQMMDETVSKYGSQSAVKMVLRYLPGGMIIGMEMTYDELKDTIDRLATALWELGVRKGDRVAVQLPNSPHTLIAFYAALKIGAIVRGDVPALGLADVAFRITAIHPQGEFATWRSTRQSSGYDVRSFQVKAKPARPIDGLRPGMSVLFDWSSR